MGPSLPSALALTTAQYSGWACVWCGDTLRKGAVSAGRAEGRIGAIDMSVEVYACPVCAIAPAPQSPAVRSGAPCGRRDDDRSALGGEARS